MANFTTMHPHHKLALLNMERCHVPFRREPSPVADAPLDFSKKKIGTQNGDHDIIQKEAESERRQIEANLLKAYGVNWRSYPRLEQAYEYLLASVPHQSGKIIDLVPVSENGGEVLNLMPASLPDRYSALCTRAGAEEIASQQITTSNYVNERHVQKDRPSQSGDTAFRQEYQLTPSRQSVQACPSLINGLNPLVGHSLLANCLMSSSTPESNGDKKGNKYVRPFKAYTNELLMNPYVSFLGQQMQNGTSNMRSVYNDLHSAAPKPMDTTCQDNVSPGSSGSSRTVSDSSGCSSKPEFSSGASQRSSPPDSFMANGDSSLEHQKLLHQISRDSPPELVSPLCDSSGVDKSGFSNVQTYRESPHSSSSFLHTSRDSNDSAEEASSSHEQSGDASLNIKRGGRALPEELKDDAYWERRRKNNQAAKRSRDQRRRKEDLIALQARVLAEENMSLRLTLQSYKEKTNFTENLILALREEKHELQLRIKSLEEEISRWRSRAAISSAPDNPSNSF